MKFSETATSREDANSWLQIACRMGFCLLAEAAISPAPASAQIAGDGSLGSLVNGSETARCLSAVCTITGGTLDAAGSTLLHSFQEFSLESAGRSARLVDPGVTDIIVRVTGSDLTVINGLLQVSESSTANLFLVNANGISFGPTAQLDLGGAFVASTAHQIAFGNGRVLVTNEASPVDDLLTISTPIGLGFLPDTPAAPITVQGSGHLLASGAPDAPGSTFVNRVFQQSTLPIAVRPENTLAFIGNGINLSGANLSAVGGQIELGSVASGDVAIGSDFSFGYGQVEQFADIELTDRSVLEVSGGNPGRIGLRGQNMTVLGSSAILAETLPEVPGSPVLVGRTGGGIEAIAEDTIVVSGFSLDPARPPFYSYLSADVAPGAVADGEDITVQAQNLRVEDGGQIGANTFGVGNAGSLQVEVIESLSLSGESPFSPSGLFSAADVSSSGNGGRLVISAADFTMDRGAQVFTSSFGQGAAGSIEVDARQVSLIGTGEPIEILLGPPTGTPSDTPPQPTILATPTLLQSSMGPVARGQGGDITIRTDQLSVTDGAEISAGTLGAGNSGDLNIASEEVTVSGFSPVEGPSSISATVGFGATGQGGTIKVDTNRLQVLDGAQIATGTGGVGTAGDLIVRGSSVLVSGRTPQGRSGLFATAIAGTGTGGNLQVVADSVVVQSGGTLSVSNFPSSENSPIPPGQGAAGNLQIQAADIVLREDGLLSADTAAGDRGNIRIDTDSLLLREGSRITTNATNEATGGNVDIAASGFVVAVPSENSDITANSVFGDGGRVTVAAQSVLGIAVQPELTSQSDITASSEFGVDGEIRLNTVDSDVRPSTESLPQSTEVPAVAVGCVPKNDSVSRFVQSGRGGVGTDPYGVLNGRTSLADVSVPSGLALEASEDDTALNTDTQASATIEEARDWQVNAQGEVVLLASVPEGHSERCLSWQL